MRRIGRRLLLLSAAVGLLVVAVPSAPAAPRPNAYVALGDSYTAGPFIGLDFQHKDVPYACAQSKYSYPYLVAAQIKAKVFRDVSCSSARTEHFSQPQKAYSQTNPPQYNALRADTSLVTIGIGGNDIGLVGMAEDCGKPATDGTTCEERNRTPEGDKYRVRIRKYAPEFVAMLKEVRRRAPAAEILVVVYPTVLPDGDGCYPYVPLTPADNRYVRGLVHSLNVLEAKLSRQHGARFVDTETSSIGHDACQIPTKAWVNGLVIVPPSFPLHPNEYGMINDAKDVRKAVVRSGWRP